MSIEDAQRIAAIAFPSGLPAWVDEVTGTPESIAFDPLSQFVSVGGCGESQESVIEWDLRTGKRTWERSLPGSAVDAVAYGKEDSTLLIACTRGYSAIGEFTAGPEGALEAYVGGERVLCEWSKRGSIPERTHRAHLDYISALVVSQQMSVAVLAGASNAGQSAEMYQLSGGTYLGTLPGQYSDVWKVRISADGEWLAAVEQNLRTLIGWNLRERRFLGRLTLESCVEDICFLGTAMKVAVATERGGVEVVDVPRMEREPLIGGVEEQVTALASHSGEEVLLYTSSREALAIWEIKGLLA